MPSKSAKDVAIAEIDLAEVPRSRGIRQEQVNAPPTNAPLGPETRVVIRRHWNDYRKGVVLFRCIKGLHWSHYSGGICASSPYLMMMGYIWCTDIISGEVAHSCCHGPAPHWIKVTIVQKDNPRNIVRELKKIAR